MKSEELATKLAAPVAAIIKKIAGELRADFAKKLAEIETAFQNQIAAMPQPEKGEKGDQGEQGIPAEVDMDQVKSLLGEMVAAIELPKPEKGEQGEPGAPGVVDMEEVKSLVQEAVAAIEIPKGEKGDPGKDAEVDMEKIWELIVEEFKKVELPEPEKGEKGDPGQVDMEAVQQLIADEVAKRDTVRVMLSEEEIEDGISERRNYARGSLARHKGGLWRAYERTAGMKGWECIVAGVSDVAIDFDGEREVTITVGKSDGTEQIKKIHVPALLYKDVYVDGQQYEKNDVVTLSGSIWVALKETKERPGISTDWKLAVKRGGTGKSAYDLARDAGFEGSRQDWLDQLGKKPTVKLP